MKKLLTIPSILTVFLLLSSNLVFSQDCPEGTWNRNQYSGPGGGLYTGRGGGMYTGRGGGMYTGRGGGMYTGRGGGMYTGRGGGLYTGRGGGLYTGRGGGLHSGPTPYCSNRPPLHILIRMGIIDSNYNLR